MNTETIIQIQTQKKEPDGYWSHLREFVGPGGAAMSELRRERIARLCEQLRLVAVTSQYASLADEAVQRKASLAEYLEAMLRSELDVRQSRSRHTLTKLAGLPTTNCSERRPWTGSGTGRTESSLKEGAIEAPERKHHSKTSLPVRRKTPNFTMRPNPGKAHPTRG